MIATMEPPMSKFNIANESAAGNRWHLNCFRCNTCGTLLDSDANLLLLGDGSLICNNCTYSCSACGNKIEDLAILTGDQAFCATCFRCRNCKRKIENLRYARTSQGIFCMSCHESLMARRRKKSRAAANAKLKKEEQSPMFVDKSLPALPPNAVLQSAFPLDRETPDSIDTDTPTELSPRPRKGYTQHDSSSRSSSRIPPERSPERTSSDAQTRDGLTLPTTTYRNNRHSAISQASDVHSGDGESFFIPLALDPSPAPSMTPRSTSETLVDTSKKSKENKAPEKDYFGSKNNGRSEPQKSREVSSSSSTPHIAFQEKGRQPSAEETAQIKDSIRKAQSGGKSSSTKVSPAIGSDDTRVQHANSPKSNGHGKTLSSADKFKLGDVPKGKKAGNSRSNSQSETSESSISRSTSSGLSAAPPRKDAGITITRTDSPKPLLSAEKAGTPQSSQESRLREDLELRSSVEPKDSSLPISRMDSSSTSRSIPRKELTTGGMKNIISSSFGSSSGAETSPSSDSSSDTPGLTPTVNGKSISGPLNLQALVKDDLAPPTRAATRPSGPQHQLSDSYMAPRAPPQPPPPSSHTPKDSSGSSNGVPTSPKLPRWSAGGDFTMDEDMARILGGTDESSQSILRRVSNAVRHGRNSSEASNSARHAGHGRSVSETTRTTASPRWPKTPIAEDSTTPKEISSPISITSPASGDDPALLRRQLRNSEQRVAELERQFTSEKDLKSLNKKLIEKRKTVSVLDSQTEIMIRQLEVLAGYVERAKDSKQPINIAELEDSAIKEFVQKLERLKQTMSGAVESLYEERNALMEEKTAIMADRDRALVEFEQLSSKNAQLADMNNDLTHQIQERFKAQSGNIMDSLRPPMNGLGIYTHHNKDKSNVSVQLDDASLRPSTGTTLFGSVSTYPQAMDQDPSMEPAAVLSAPHVINIRKGQAKKFNWKKGGQTVAKGVSKGFKGAFSSAQQERNQQWPSQTGDSIGLPYNMTVAPVESPAGSQPGNFPRSASNDPARQGGGFALFKKSNTMPKSITNGNVSAAEHPSTLFGSELVERADFERRQIPSVVTRCIEEVELRGMDVEGIYRKTGGSGQVKIIQEGFDKTEDYDISDPGLDITAVTSVLKQYFRKLPTPLLTFDIYDRVLESTCKY